MSRFVRPDTDKLELTGGDWVLVKRQLTAGEQRRAFSRHSKARQAGEPVDVGELDLDIVKQYLLDWSLTDDTGRVVLIRDQPSSVVAAALDALDPASYREISDAISAHNDRVKLELDAKKKNQDTATKFSVISGSAG